MTEPTDLWPTDEEHREHLAHLEKMKAEQVQAAMEVAGALTTLQLALYRFERLLVKHDPDSEDGGEAFNEAFADTARLMGRLSDTLDDIIGAEVALATAVPPTAPPAGT